MWKNNLIKIAIILVPTYTVAYLTDKMIYVIPMLAVCTLIVATYDPRSKRRTDEDIDIQDLGSKKDDG
jgi:hypothetical protein|tara:strand:+ start:55 stop:258 length:204 start_codon:yes stop_codon:yes gene_type:complete